MLNEGWGLGVGGSPKPVLEHRVHAPSSRNVIYLASRCEKDIDYSEYQITCDELYL